MGGSKKTAHGFSFFKATAAKTPWPFLVSGGKKS
jgi:hypothetical protein